MNGVLEILVGLLCSGNTAYNCEQFLQPYEGNTVLQILWFVFFPMIFIVIFTYLLADGVAHNIGGKLKALIGIAIIMLVIVQGWYHFVLLIAKVWWLALILLGGLFVFTHKMGVKDSSGGGGGQHQTATAGLLATTLFGTRAQALRNPHQIVSNRKLCEDRIRELQAQVDELNILKNQAAGDKEKSEITRLISELTAKIVVVKKRKAEGLPPDV